MPKYNNIYDAIRDNSKKECSVRTCRNNRNRIGSLCENCGKQRWYWGHPEARAIYKRDYHYEVQAVQKVIEKNLKHDGIKHGINFLNNYMKGSVEGSTYLPGFKHAIRHYEAGVDGFGILVELAAIYLLSRNVHTPVKDHRHLKYLLGSKFIRYTPCSIKVRGTENRDVGEYLNENIGVLLLNISKFVEKQEESI